LKLGLQPLEVKGSQAFEGAFAAISKQRIDAVVVQSETMFLTNAKTIADFAASRRIPSAGSRGYADAGGLISYAHNILELYHGTVVLVDKILKGASPADLPVEQPTKFELVINLKTAKALGIKVPQSVLLRADRVIE